MWRGLDTEKVTPISHVGGGLITGTMAGVSSALALKPHNSVFGSGILPKLNQFLDGF